MPTKSEEPSTDNSSHIMEELTSDWPDADQQFVSPESSNVDTGVTMDGSFDPNIHRSDSNGQPIRNKDGSFAKRKGPRKGGGTRQPSPVDADKCKATAEVTVSMLTMVCTVTLGQEWIAQADEHSNMVTAWTNYYIAQGVVELPAWAELSVAMSAYAIPRIGQPETSGRIRRFGGWLRSKVSRRR